MFSLLQRGQQTTCALPEMFGDGTLDVRVHGEAQVRAQALEDRGDEKENQGEWKQTRQHRRVSEWVSGLCVLRWGDDCLCTRYWSCLLIVNLSWMYDRSPLGFVFFLWKKKRHWNARTLTGSSKVVKKRTPSESLFVFVAFIICGYLISIWTILRY